MPVMTTSRLQHDTRSRAAARMDSRCAPDGAATCHLAGFRAQSIHGSISFETATMTNEH